MEKLDIRSMTFAELEGFVKSLSEPAYRAEQIFSWIHQKGAEGFADMTNLPLSLRTALAERGHFSSFVQAGKRVSKMDETTKYLFALENNTIIESVLMRYAHGRTLCVSTQAGCRMGCRFCASATGGLQRNLTAGEMCAQIYAAQKDTGCRVDGVVLMGCGEPLDNFENTLRFITLATHSKGHFMGQRHITISTCGLVPAIRTLAEKKLQITLALSLHAPNDTIRKTLMPIARKYTLSETLKACAYYAQHTHRRITIEYALIDALNDSDANAHELAQNLSGLLCHVNLIPLNEVRDHYRQSPRAHAFARILTRNRIPVTIRRTTGEDIEAACGQLRGRHLGLF